ncbi:MAG TPA: helix-turn-helix transcriptional regulator [Pseudonocardiaceae bacterium]|nr:helix-turn-helix transcriptional regulator [Pseudonocardiaceae bacterium]
MGRVFRAYRNHPRHLQIYGKPLSQELLGRWLGIKQGYVSKLENGSADLNTKALQGYSDALHIPHQLLWFAFPGESRRFNGNGSHESDVEQSTNLGWWRKDEPGQLSRRSTSELIALAASESAQFGLRHEVSEIHASSMEQIDEEVRRLSIDFVAGDPFDTFLRSRQLRDDIFALLDKRVFPHQERMLYAFAARTCGYLAAASSDFYGQYDAGADHCRVARRFSDIADSPELRAWALSLHSGVSFWQGNWTQAATLAERAGELAITRSGALRAASMQARALARLGDVEHLQAIVDSSQEVHSDAHSEDENGMILFSDINHLRCIGTANLWAGRSVEAQEQLTRALRSYLSDAPEDFAVIATIRADLALSFLNGRDVDGAAESISPLLDMESGQRLEGVYRRMRNLCSLLQSDEYANSAAASDLSTCIEEFLTSSRPVTIDADEEQ